MVVKKNWKLRFRWRLLFYIRWMNSCFWINLFYILHFIYWAKFLGDKRSYVFMTGKNGRMYSVVFIRRCIKKWKHGFNNGKWKSVLMLLWPCDPTVYRKQVIKLFELFVGVIVLIQVLKDGTTMIFEIRGWPSNVDLRRLHKQRQSQLTLKASRKGS